MQYSSHSNQQSVSEFDISYLDNIGNDEKIMMVIVMCLSLLTVVMSHREFSQNNASWEESWN